MQRPELDFLRRNFPVILVGGLTAALSLGLWVVGGTRLGGDSRTYMDAADQLRLGSMVSGVPAMYIAYVAVLAAFSNIHLVVAFQIIVGAVAAVLLTSIATRRAAVAAFGVGFFALNPDIVRWHTYILTDSLYISLMALTIWALWIAIDDPVPMKLFLIVAFALCSALIRPTGWFVVIAALAFVVARSQSRRVRGTTALCGLGLFLLLGVLPATHDRVAVARPGAKIAQGVVIPGDESTWISMPVSEMDDEGVEGATAYLLQNPVAVARLSLARISTELVGIRSYYSPAHNLVIAAFLLPTYVLAATALWLGWRDPGVRWTSLIIAVHLVFIAVAFASYDARFLAYMLPGFALLAAIGIQELLRRRAARLTKNQSAAAA